MSHGHDAQPSQPVRDVLAQRLSIAIRRDVAVALATLDPCHEPAGRFVLHAAHLLRDLGVLAGRTTPVLPIRQPRRCGCARSESTTDVSACPKDTHDVKPSCWKSCRVISATCSWYRSGQRSNSSRLLVNAS